MINHDIQELFDGKLSDEQTAELLHALSVSPERRTDFRHHMALQGAMERDRSANGLTPDEDAAIWGGIVGLTPAATAVGSAAGIWSWIGRGAAVLAVGIGGYLLGTSDLPSISDGVASQPAVKQSGPVATVPPLVEKSASTSTSGDNLQQKSVQPTIVYRDREVIKYRYIYRQNPDGNSLLAERPNQNGSTKPANDSGVLPLGDGKSIFDPNTARAQSNRPISNSDGGSSSSIDSTLQSHQKNGPNPAQPESDPNKALNSKTEGNSDIPAESTEGPIAALQTGGFEAAYSERVGRLTAMPKGEGNSPSYASRYLDLSFRFDRGRWGVGARLGHGSFSTVSLIGRPDVRREGASTRIDTIYTPTLGQSSELALELFANHRLPLGNRFAVGLEGTYQASTTHHKIGGDLFALWFITDQIGLQGGIGLSRYWYDISDQRQQVLSKGENVGVSTDVLDSYSGSVLEGRYGIFYRF